MMTKLEAKGVSTRQGTHAAAMVGYYTRKYDLHPEQYPNAYLAERLSLTLPLFVQMTEDEQNFVCNSIEEANARVSA